MNPQNGKKQSKLKLAALAAIAIALIALAGFKLYGRTESGITATGTIEVTKTDITPKLGGYLVELMVREGDRVTPGQKVARIDRPDLQAQWARDEAALNRARAQLRDLELGARSQELQEAAASLSAARSLADKAKADYDRFSRLFQEGAIAVSQLDNSRSAYEVAENNRKAAQARYSLLQAGNRPEAIQAQRLEVERARAVLEGTRIQLNETTVLSPLAGRVLSKNYESGEYVNPGAAIATIGNLQDCWVKIYVSTGQLGQIRLGQKAKVRIDAFPDKTFSGEVSEISQNAEYTPRQSITQRERANMVFAVKVKIENGEEFMKPGLPADVALQ